MFVVVEGCQAHKIFRVDRQSSHTLFFTKLIVKQNNQQCYTPMYYKQDWSELKAFSLQNKIKELLMIASIIRNI